MLSTAIGLIFAVQPGLYNEPIVSGPIDLGEFGPVNGNVVLRVELVGTIPQSGNAQYAFGPQCVVTRQATGGANGGSKGGVRRSEGSQQFNPMHAEASEPAEFGGQGLQADSTDLGAKFWMSRRTELSATIAENTRSAKLPASVDLRPTFDSLHLPIQRQRGPYCWAYSTIGMIEYEAAIQLGQRFSLSPGYLAWAGQAADGNGSGGSNFGRAYRGILSFGAVPFSLDGDTPPEGMIPDPPDETVKIGKSFGDIEFHWIRFWNRKEMSAEEMREIKSNLANGHPVAVGLFWPKHLEFYPNTFTMKVPELKDVADGHGIILVGYQDDDRLPGGGAFVFRNSWGPEWGDHGYAWMPYKLLSFCINDSCSIGRISPEKPEANRRFVSFDAADLDVTEVTGSFITIQPQAPFGRAWGHVRQIFFRANEPEQGFSVQLPVARTGNYDVQIVIARAQDYGRFLVEFPDGSTSTIIDGEGPGVSQSRPISLGAHALRQGVESLRFIVKGRSNSSSGMCMGLRTILIARRSN